MCAASRHYGHAAPALPVGWVPALAVALAVLLSACASQPSKRPAAATGTSTQAAVHAPAIHGANDVLMRSLGLIGTPYRWGGNTPEGGFDCSGLVHFVFSDAAGLSLPRTSQQMADFPAPKVDRRQLAPGDLVFFGQKRAVSHVGIYVGEGRFVHAPNEGGTVRIDALDGHYWRDTYLFARRPLENRTAGGTTSGRAGR